ncbi:hypothetical protein J7T55_010480 [Diaporthe amygdali]|uniref:uncharacterized protein n=1 Tax=Phomopsis amygdali TaxID=1214568 RepID=UPI0022FECF5D|nr:uncharacterized protein J7T55_010480 [Diaporthe amygdali]KAJ0115657.1 hypothetical protein J7T55_010480 [Diaporthe amygdali]
MGDHFTSPKFPFKHDPLPDPAKYIRLLEILDNNNSQITQIACRLTKWRADSLPSYHAISYTWGEAESNTVILINGKPFTVRTNCEFVLKQARWHGKSQYYWVDAVCIDQENLEEKSRQVLMMGTIYKQAEHVLACVGDHADDSLFFYQTLKHFLPVGERKKWIFRRKGQLSLRFRLGHRSSTTRRLLLAAARFAMRPYFTRLWILQELHNARDVSFLCGMEALPKDGVRLMLSDLHSVMPYGAREGSRTFIGRLLTRLWFLRRIAPQHQFLSWSFLEYLQLSGKVFKSLQITKAYAHAYSTWRLLDIASCLECADKRDKVYGILSIISWGSVTAMVPDYTQDEFRIAIDFISALVELEEVSKEDICLQDISFLTTGNLGLNYWSRGVSDALKARRSNPEEVISREAETRLEAPLLSSSRYAAGWCVLSEHLDRSRPEYSIWTPPGNEDRDVYLPSWTRPGDWVIEVRGHAFGWFATFECPALLVMREIGHSQRGPFIGHGFGSIGGTELALAKFQVHWDAEDLVILCLTMNDPGKIGKGWDDWLEDFLNAGVCRQQAPGSSYAIRRDDV